MKLEERLELLLGNEGGPLSVWVVILNLETFGGETTSLKGEK